MSTAKRCQLVVSVLLLLIIPAVSGCFGQQTYKIGFVGGLTGRYSDLGVAGRNGITLAVEEINKAGGIHGRPVELIVRDDKNDPAVVRAVDEELINAGVRILIGHMTSAAAVASLPVSASGKALIVTPTATADSLRGNDDMLITIMSPLKLMAQVQAAYAVQELGLKRLVIIGDSSNPEYARNWAEVFTAYFESFGGKVVATLPFASGSGVEYESLAQAAAGYRPEGILLVAGAVDAAVMSQWLRKGQPAVPIFSSSWAMTNDFIHHGGQAVEGIVFSSTYSPDNHNPAYIRFAHKYRERFGSWPNYAAAHSYEAAQLVLTGINKAGNDQALAVKQAIIGQQQFSGLWDDYLINAAGDASRVCRLVIVKNGQFVTLDKK